MFNKYVVDLVGCAKPGKAYVCSNRVICMFVHLQTSDQAGNIIPRHERRKVHAIFVGFFVRVLSSLWLKMGTLRSFGISPRCKARNKRLMSKISKASIRKASKSRWTVCPTSTFTRKWRWRRERGSQHHRWPRCFGCLTGFRIHCTTLRYALLLRDFPPKDPRELLSLPSFC